jgi:hypothetical protein
MVFVRSFDREQLSTSDRKSLESLFDSSPDE